MTRHGPLAAGTLSEWRNGAVTLSEWRHAKVRNLLWLVIPPVVLMGLAIGVIAFIRYWLVKTVGVDAMTVIGRSIHTAIGLAIVGAAAGLMRSAIRGRGDILPMFDADIPRFPPRPVPVDGDWNRWLKKGVRIGRWQQSLDRKRTRPGPAVWMPIKGMPGIFCAGEAGQGKSTFLHNVLYELSPAVDADAVRAVMFDYKMGMEMDAVTGIPTDGVTPIHKGGKPLVSLDHFHYGAEVGTATKILGLMPLKEVWGYEETAVPYLRNYVALMRDRAEEMRGSGREHMARPGDPHYVIIFDEAAQFNRDHVPLVVRNEVNGLIDTLANQGRACGFTVIVCTQYPSLEHIKFRHGLLWGLALKVKTPQAVDMVLGQGAWRAGKRANALPRALRGVGYVGESGPYGAMPLRLVNTGPDIPEREDADADGEPEFFPPIESEYDQPEQPRWDRQDVP